MIIIKGGHRRRGAGGYIHAYSLRRRFAVLRSGGSGRRRNAPGWLPASSSPVAPSQQPRQTSSYADFRPSHPLSSSLPTETLGKLAGLRLRCRKLPSGPSSCSDHVWRAGAGHHSHGTARLVRREGLQVFTPSSSALMRDSCPFRARPGRPRCAPSALTPPALHLPRLPRGAAPARCQNTI